LEPSPQVEAKLDTRVLDLLVTALALRFQDLP